MEKCLYLDNTSTALAEAMVSSPRKDIENFNELLQEENLYLITEEGEQGRLPLLILSMKGDSKQRRPAIVFIPSSNKPKEWICVWQEAYALRGYIAVAVDTCYHGEGASSLTYYHEALISSWKKGDTMPFLFDTAWDMVKLADYLTQREDIDPLRTGITGLSLGGMHAWFAASAADERCSVVVPIMGVQGFQWAIDNDQWQGRVENIKPVFEEARIDLGKSAIDKEVVEKPFCGHGFIRWVLHLFYMVWDRIAPGLASDFDAPNSIPAIAPRPLLIITGEEDPRCPLEGLQVPKLKAYEAHKKANCPDNFQLYLEQGIEHYMTPLMGRVSSEWFDRFLKP